MALSEHVYCVAATLKMTEQREQWICIKIAWSLNIPLRKQFGWFRRLQLWATSDWQLHDENMPTHASRVEESFLSKHQITLVTRPTYSPDLAPCNFWSFPKLKSPLKRKRFQTVDETLRNTMGQLMAIGRTVRFQSTYLEGVWGDIVLCTMFLASSSINVSIFHIIWLDPFWTDLIHFQILTAYF